MHKLFIVTILLTLSLSLKPSRILAGGKDPIIVELTTNFKTVKEACLATKKILIEQKFIPNGPITDGAFTATRTTGAKQDYYTADVVAEQVGDKVKVTITLLKVGTGLLRLKKVAEELTEGLTTEKKSDNEKK